MFGPGAKVKLSAYASKIVTSGTFFSAMFLPDARDTLHRWRKGRATKRAVSNDFGSELNGRPEGRPKLN
jgi:hypothetical protein